MLTILIQLVVFVVSCGLATVLVVFVSALCIGLADTCYQRAKAASTAIGGKSGDAHQIGKG